MVSVMILDVGQNCDLKPTYPKSYQNHIKIVSKPYQNRIKTVSKSWENHRGKKNIKKSTKNLSLSFFWFLYLKPTHWNHIKIVSK